MAVVEDANLPTAPEELTAEWFSSALGTEVSEVLAEEIVWGTATKVLVKLQYRDPGNGLPESVCVKGGFAGGLEEIGSATADAYRIEARFFGDLAEKLPLTLPRTFYTAVTPDAHQGIVVMEDLRAAGGTFGDPCIAFTADQVAAGLEMQAKLHAVTPDVATTSAPWLRIGSPAVRAVANILLSAGHWDSFYSNTESPSLPVSVNNRERVLRAFEALWAYEDGAARYLTHGDAHIGNTFIGRDNAIGFLDWQGTCLAPWSYDVAYFITGALSVADRREYERDLLKHYLSALGAAGGPEMDADGCWTDYRRHALHGFLWAVTPPVMQSVERVHAMTERHVAAIEDLESLTLLCC